MKTKRQRAFNVNIMGEKAYTIGGDSAGRFYSNGTTSHKPRKSVRNRHCRVKLSRVWSLCKWIFWIIVITYFLSTIQISYKPFIDVKAEEVPLPLNGATSFESADPPAGFKGDKYDEIFGNDAKIMRSVCKAENTAEDPMKVGDKHLTYWVGNELYGMSVGLCQIRILQGRNITIADMQDPTKNLLKAKEILDSQGLKAWACYKNGSYKKYLNQVEVK